ncbi:MAG: hypothetical protein QW692_02205 [Nitrososphaerota archaeon]
MSSEERMLERVSPVRMYIQAHEYHVVNPDLRTALSDAGVKALGPGPSFAINNNYFFVMPFYITPRRDPATGGIRMETDADKLARDIEETRRNGGMWKLKLYVKVSEPMKPDATFYMTATMVEEDLKTLSVMSTHSRAKALRLLNVIVPPRIDVGVRIGEESHGGVPYISGQLEIEKPPSQRPEAMLSYRDIAKRVEREAR